MNIVVVGAGAMGSLFGGLLAEAGNAVRLYDIWKEHVDCINTKGLAIERQGQTRLIKIRATTDPRSLDRAALVIVFVKSTHTTAAAATAAQIIGQAGFVLTLQNGMGNAETIAESIDAGHILAGTTSHGATVLGPGRIRHAGVGPTVIGLWAGSQNGRSRAEEFGAIFTAAGIDTETVADVRHIIWNKLLINIGINAITALTGIKNGQLLDLEATRELSRKAVEEAAAVARAQGIAPQPDALTRVFQIAEATALNRSSMGQDIDNRRQTEIAAINGFIVREGRRLGIDTPVNQTLTALIETLQSHY